MEIKNEPIFEGLEWLDNQYHVLNYGTGKHFTFMNKKPAMRKAEVQSKLRGKVNYVEVWYHYPSGKDILVAYFN